MTHERNDLDDLLDQLVSQYSDALQKGLLPDRGEYLARVPEDHREALNRCMGMMEAGLTGTAPAPPALAAGSVLGGYQVRELLGRGGMAHIFRAYDERLRRDVALKVLRPGLTLDPRHVDRFHREATAIARLSHPHVIQVHDVGEEDGLHYIAMEWIDGKNLDQVFRSMPGDRAWTGSDLLRALGREASESTPLPFEQIFAGLMLQVAQGVAAAHAAGLVHRDLKPSNILIHPDGRAIVADFGLAKGDTDPALSLTGELIGTPHYMSPEQVAQTSDGIDARSDIYSLGVTLYEGLAGRRPHRGETTLKVLDSIQNEQPDPIRACVPARTRNAQAIVTRAMAKDPAQRHRSAAELVEDLEALAAGLRAPSLALAGGWPRRMFAGMGRVLSGRPLEYISSLRFAGLPLIHVRFAGRNAGARRRPAKGIIAIGSVAVGGIAIGGIAMGGFACGVVSLGLVTLGAALAVGGLAIGMGCGLGALATGGMAAGYAAVGGMTAANYSIAGKAFGPHQISGERVDQNAVDWFNHYMPWLLARLPAELGAGSSEVGPQDSHAESSAAWEHGRLAQNGIEVSLLEVEDAETQSFFTLIPLSLVADEAGHAQYSHLVEHMLIRATDPESLLVDGLRLNGETTSLCMRLESIGPADKWRESLGKHAAWLAASEFDADTLEREKLMVAGEENSTVRSGYTGKWADVAWNQVVRHGRKHAAVHDDVASATVEDLTEYVIRNVPISSAVRLVGVGPIPADEVWEYLESGIGMIPQREVDPYTSEWHVAPGEYQATWDLDAYHYMEWYRLPDRGHEDRVASRLLGNLITAALFQNPRLRARNIQAIASADLITTEGRFLRISAGVQSIEDADLLNRVLAEVLKNPLPDLDSSGVGSQLLANFSGQLMVLPDFRKLRESVASPASRSLVEAQVALNQINHRVAIGLFDERVLRKAHAEVTPKLLDYIVREALRPSRRSTLLLSPKR